MCTPPGLPQFEDPCLASRWHCPISSCRAHGVAEIGQQEYIDYHHNADQSEPGARLSPCRTPVQKGDQEQEQTGHPKAENADHIAVNAEDMAGQILQRLKHEHEIPLGFDARWSGGKWIGFLAQLRREEGSQPGK